MASYPPSKAVSIAFGSRRQSRRPSAVGLECNDRHDHEDSYKAAHDDRSLEEQQVDDEEARAFLRQMTDELIELVGQVNEGQRSNAAIQAVNEGVRDALVVRRAAEQD